MLNSVVDASGETPAIKATSPLSATESETHSRAMRAALSFRHSEAELMEALISVGETKLHLRMGYPSLFAYATDALKLSEAVAYSAISVARKAREIPVLREAIGSGELGLSKAKKVLSVLNPRASAEEQAGWVGRAVALSSRKLERAVATENPRAAVAERATYRAANRIELVLGVSEELLLEIRQAQNLVSSGRAGAATLEGTLAEVVRFYLERKDPERRARRIVAKKGFAPDAEPDAKPAEHRREQFTGTVRDVEAKATSKREPLRAALAHRVRIRDQNRCQAEMPDGGKCGSRRWLEIHHRVPVSEGGGNAFANLTTLCRAHHQAHHQAQVRP